MRLFLILFAFFLAFESCAQRKKVKATISELTKVEGLITYSDMYCGGAPPPESLLQELQKPKPLPKYTLYIRKDSNDMNKPILYTVITDSLGKFRISLPVGKYTVVDYRKKDKATFNEKVEKYKTSTQLYSAIDKSCYLRYFGTPDFSIIVVKNQKSQTVEYNYVRKCEWSSEPCVSYKGPLPQ